MKLIWTDPSMADLRAIRDYIGRDSERHHKELASEHAFNPSHTQILCPARDADINPNVCTPPRTAVEPIRSLHFQFEDGTAVADQGIHFTPSVDGEIDQSAAHQEAGEEQECYCDNHFCPPVCFNKARLLFVSFATNLMASATS